MVGFVFCCSSEVITLLVKEINLLGSTLKKSLQQYLLVNFFLDSSIYLLISVRDEALIFAPYLLSKLAEVLFPETNVPAIVLFDLGDSDHTCMSSKACVPKDAVFVEIYDSPDSECFL